MRSTIFFIAGLFCFTGMHCDYITAQYIIEAHYTDYDEARSLDAIAPAEPYATWWLPGLLPKSAYDIYEAHDLDGSEQWLKFSVDDVTKELFCESCDFIDIKYVETPRRNTFSWWPKNVNQNEKKYTYMRCYEQSRNMRYWLAIDNNTVYFWSRRKN